MADSPNYHEYEVLIPSSESGRFTVYRRRATSIADAAAVAVEDFPELQRAGVAFFVGQVSDLSGRVMFFHEHRTETIAAPFRAARLSG